MEGTAALIHCIIFYRSKVIPPNVTATMGSAFFSRGCFQPFHNESSIKEVIGSRTVVSDDEQHNSSMKRFRKELRHRLENAQETIRAWVDEDCSNIV